MGTAALKKKKNLAVKKGMNTLGGEPFFSRKNIACSLFLGGVRMWKFVSKVRISGFGYPSCWIGFQTWQLHPGGFGFSLNPLDFDFSAKKSLVAGSDRSRTIVEKALERSRERPKVRWAKGTLQTGPNHGVRKLRIIITTRTRNSAIAETCKMYPDCLGDVYISYKKMGGGIFNPPAMLGTTGFLVALYEPSLIPITFHT